MKIKTSDIMCSGCNACVQVCPKNAIKMKSDSRGFEYPFINKEICIDCSLCSKVCQCNESILKSKREVRAYGVRHLDIEVRKRSQSGGLFSGLAEIILNFGGVCYGASICDDLVVKQIRIQSLEELYKLQGSKYVQSDSNMTFSQVEQDLRRGLKVLYSGTSCMIDGLLKYLNIKKMNMDNLIICDLICHGVPSPQFYKNNLDRLRKRNNSSIIAVDFRNKQFGWDTHVETYKFNNGNEVNERYYTELFYSHLILRECCYSCHYVNLQNKQADITMADFWGANKCNPQIIDDNNGWSLGIVHTKKGEDLLHKGNFECLETDLTNALQNNMTQPARKPIWYKRFWRDYEKFGYEYCLKKYTIYGGNLFKIKRKILKKMGRW